MMDESGLISLRRWRSGLPGLTINGSCWKFALLHYSDSPLTSGLKRVGLTPRIFLVPPAALHCVVLIKHVALEIDDDVLFGGLIGSAAFSRTDALTNLRGLHDDVLQWLYDDLFSAYFAAPIAGFGAMADEVAHP